LGPANTGAAPALGRGYLCPGGPKPRVPSGRPRDECYSLAMSLTAMAVLVFALAPAPKTSLPFIEDDYRRGLAEARARNLPLFIEVWAPW
jgi:hypothetical protein